MPYRGLNNARFPLASKCGNYQVVGWTLKVGKNHQAASDDWWTLITAGFGSVNWKFVGLTSDNSV